MECVFANVAMIGCIKVTPYNIEAEIILEREDFLQMLIMSE